jgi:hypothetical protein
VSGALELNGNQGAVRIAGCSLTGLGSMFGALVVLCENVAFVSCRLLGGRGPDYVEFSHGGNGLDVGNSRVAVFDSETTGGQGGSWAYDCGNGGDGAKLFVGGEMFAAGTTFRGGKGGDAMDQGWGVPAAGNGGNALNLVAGSTADLLDNVYIYGPAGWCYGFGNCIYGGNGATIKGPGTAIHHPGMARRFKCDALVSDGQDLSVTVLGDAGDRNFIVPADSPAYVPSVAPPGVWLVEPPTVLPIHIGTHPAAGSFSYPLPIAPLSGFPNRIAGHRMWLQGFVLDAQRSQHLGNPLFVLALRRLSTPDCNGNGVNDFIDVIENKALDLDNNLIPDSCEP